MNHKFVAGVLLAGSLGLGLFAMPSQAKNTNGVSTAEARTRSAKVISTKKLHKTVVHVTKGSLYSSAKLTNIIHNAKNYKHTTFYRTKQSTIRKTNGKKAVYQFIKSSNGKVTGWIWHGYVKNGKANKKGSSSFNPAKANKDFLKVVNKERKKRGAKPLKIESRFMKLAQQRANDSAKLGDLQHDNKAGDSYFVLEAPKFNIKDDWLSGECLFEETSPDKNVGKTAANEYLYNDASSDWGHRDILVDDESTFIGIGWTDDGYQIYNAIITGCDAEEADARQEIESENDSYTLTLADGTTKTFNNEDELDSYFQSLNN